MTLSNRVRSEVEGGIHGQWGSALCVSLDSYKEVTRKITVRRMDLARIIELPPSGGVEVSRASSSGLESGDGGRSPYSSMRPRGRGDEASVGPRLNLPAGLPTSVQRTGSSNSRQGAC